MERVLAIVLLRAKRFPVDGELGFANSVCVSSWDGVVCRVALIRGYACRLVRHANIMFLVRSVCYTIERSIVISEDNIDLLAALVIDEEIG